MSKTEIRRIRAYEETMLCIDEKTGMPALDFGEPFRRQRDYRWASRR